MTSKKFAYNRIGIIKRIVKGKDVLDLGVTDLEMTRAVQGSTWLHKIICDNAKNCIGVDNDIDEIKKMNALGYKIVYADVENFDLKRKFDVIIAGELIEHISNNGLFIKCCKKHLKEDGLLIITTPNSTGFMNFLKVLFRGEEREPKHVDHVLWHNFWTLENLLDRHGLIIIKKYYLIGGRRPKNLKQKAVSILARIFCMMRLEFSPQILAIIKKK